MRTLFAAAAALSATTILTGTIAAAAPMVPQAPADCQSYKFTGMGTIIEIRARTSSPGGVPTADRAPSTPGTASPRQTAPT
jgi:hypothetical protein